MARDFWIYQKRECAKPWSMYVYKYNGMLAITIYHEDIGTDEHAKSYLDIYFPSVDQYVDFLTVELLEFTEVWAQDRAQLFDSISQILAS